MTKQDFEFFASYIVKHNIRGSAVGELVELFKKRNGLFDEDRFYEAVGKLRNQRERLISE